MAHVCILECCDGSYYVGSTVHLDQAFAFEKQVQGWNRRKREALIEGRLDELPTLASRSWTALRFRDGR
jgi:putative endonuclease